MSVINSIPLIAAGDDGYQISRSVRFRSSASAYLNRTFSTPTNQKKWTLSCWIKRGALSSTGEIFNGAQSGTNDNYIRFTGGNALMMGSYNGVGTDYGIVTTAVFRDPSAWYHCVFVYDVDNATSTDRAIIYVNGVRQAVSNNGNGMFPSGYTSAAWNTAVSHRISSNSPSAIYSDQYLTEMVFVDGQALTPSSFGENDAVTGVWKPKKYTGTYGTNGFYLNFSDNSSNTATTIGKDYSGNGNNWTPNNISVTSGVTYDSMLDTPTPYADGGNGRGNYCVLNPLDKGSSGTMADGNLSWSYGSASWQVSRATMALPSTGKWYWEVPITSLTSYVEAGVATSSASLSAYIGNDANGWSWQSNATKLYNGTGTSYGTSASVNDVLMVAVDRGSSKIWVGRQGTWLASGDPAAGTNEMFSGLTTGDLFAAVACYQGTVAVNFGQRPFSYTPPSGFVALNTQNLPTPTISNGANYMAATLWAGTGTTNSQNNAVNGISFQPDFVWIKDRTAASSHQLYDVIRGTTKGLSSDLTSAEYTVATGLTAFNSNGFTVVSDSGVNFSGRNYVGWQWQAGKGSTSSNTSGTITSTVSVGATQGFSVVTYTGTGSAATVGHGLGVAPKMVIVKSRSNATDWPVYHAGMPSAAYYLYLQSTQAQATAASIWNNTAPSSSVFSVGSGGTNTNGSGYTYVAYCFAEVAGYSKFGLYTGNGSADGPFVYLGFRPRFVLIKRTDTAGNSWLIYDSSRVVYNADDLVLYPNLSNAEDSGVPIDILSNGFKQRTSWTNGNASGGTYIFAAFAENPYKLSLAR